MFNNKTEKYVSAVWYQKGGWINFDLQHSNVPFTRSIKTVIIDPKLYFGNLFACDKSFNIFHTCYLSGEQIEWKMSMPVI